MIVFCVGKFECEDSIHTMADLPITALIEIASASPELWSLTAKTWPEFGRITLTQYGREMFVARHVTYHIYEGFRDLTIIIYCGNTRRSVYGWPSLIRAKRPFDEGAVANIISMMARVDDPLAMLGMFSRVKLRWETDRRPHRTDGPAVIVYEAAGRGPVTNHELRKLVLRYAGCVGWRISHPVTPIGDCTCNHARDRTCNHTSVYPMDIPPWPPSTCYLRYERWINGELRCDGRPDIMDNRGLRVLYCTNRFFDNDRVFGVYRALYSPASESHETFVCVTRRESDADKVIRAMIVTTAVSVLAIIVCLLI